jgi:hypothetical protein
MTATEANRTLITGIFAALAERNSQPFVEAMADDVQWSTPGSSVWSRRFIGKQAVLSELLGPVRAQLDKPVYLTVQRIVADGDVVIVQARGQATTRTGKPYNNEYCFVYRIAGGKIAEVTEYIDTELASSVLVAPWASAPAP